MPTFGSLFAGIGGMDLGLERAGWECRWQVEVDPWCQRVLSKHWPEVPKFGDVKQVTGSELDRVDLMAGGFPCPPVSQAGKGLAQQDPRWLWPDFARLIGEVRPRLVLVENVPGLLNVNGGSAFGDVLGDLAALGFDAEWDCIPAAAVGAPHRCDRVWLVAYSHGEGLDRREEPNGGARREQGRQGNGSLGDDADGLRVALADAKVFSERPGLCTCSSASERGRRSCDSCRSRESWSAEPDVGRVAHGVPSRVDRLAALGNAVVPAIPEWIGRRLIELA